VEFQVIKKFDMKLKMDQLINSGIEYETTKSGAYVPSINYEGDNYQIFDKELLMAMLMREDVLRKSEKWLTKYSRVLSQYETGRTDLDDALVEIDKKIRVQVLIDFGFQKARALDVYQLSCGYYMDDEEVKQCVVWMKYDKMKLGRIQIGEEYINCEIRNLRNERCMLSDLLPNQEKPIVLLAGSYS